MALARPVRACQSARMAVTAATLDRCPHCGALDIVTRGERVECLACKQVSRLADLAPCPRCGEILPSPSDAAAHCARPSTAPEGAPGAPRALGGALLFLALSLSALGPLKFLLSLVQFLVALGARELDPELATFTWAAVAADATVTAALAFAGLRLFAMHPHAIRTCRRALLLAPAVGAVELAAASRLGLLFDDTLPAAAFGTARTAVVALAWLAYLESSKRVRETFPG